MIVEPQRSASSFAQMRNRRLRPAPSYKRAQLLWDGGAFWWKPICRVDLSLPDSRRLRALVDSLRLIGRIGFGVGTGVALPELRQLRHPCLKFADRRLAVMTSGDRTWLEPMPDRAGVQCWCGNSAEVVSARRIRLSRR
jgi:hypothetical protein